MFLFFNRKIRNWWKKHREKREKTRSQNTWRKEKRRRQRRRKANNVQQSLKSTCCVIFHLTDELATFYSVHGHTIYTIPTDIRLVLYLQLWWISITTLMSLGPNSVWFLHVSPASGKSRLNWTILIDLALGLVWIIFYQLDLLLMPKVISVFALHYRHIHIERNCKRSNYSNNCQGNIITSV